MTKFWKYLFAMLAGIYLSLVLAINWLPDGRLHVFVLNIGQGDSILIEGPFDEKILVDGGPDNKVLNELGKVLPFYEKDLDAVILTHPHADHVNGLVEVLKRFNVGAVMITGVNSNETVSVKSGSYSENSGSNYEQFLGLVNDKHIKTFFIDGSEDFKIGVMMLDMLYPMNSIAGEHFANLNDSSIVFKLIFGKEKFLFTGDLEKKGEDELIKSGLNLRADFLKVGHHGSKTSSSVEFLEAVKAQIAAISCGLHNKFHHPYPETLVHLKDAGMKVYRTDLDGTIQIISDGKTLGEI